MSTQKGNTQKQRSPAHQNRTAFHHNKNSKLTKKGLCEKCHAIVDWKKKYRKYKPLTTARRCQACEQKTVTHAYHVICQNCAKTQEACAKCREKKEIKQKFVTEEDKQKKEKDFADFINQLSERQKRSFMRKLDRGEIEDDYLEQLKQKGKSLEDGLAELELDDEDDIDEDDNDEDDDEDDEMLIPNDSNANNKPKPPNAKQSTPAKPNNTTNGAPNMKKPTTTQQINKNVQEAHEDEESEEEAEEEEEHE